MIVMTLTCVMLIDVHIVRSTGHLGLAIEPIALFMWSGNSMLCVCLPLLGVSMFR